MNKTVSNIRVKTAAILYTIAFPAFGLLLTCSSTLAEDFPIRAPDALLGTTLEMTAPGFWIDRISDPDRIIMTAPEIETLNRKNISRVIGSGHPYADNIAKIEKDGPVFNRMNPFGTGKTYPADTVRKRLDQNIGRLMKTTLYDRWELPFTDSKKAEIREAMNVEAVPETIRPRIAVLVRHSSARLYPTAEPGYRMRNYLDDINVTSLDIGMPVAVLHTSKTGDYFFVMSPIAWGWVPAQDIAFGSAKKIRTFREADIFIVITGHREPFYADEECTTITGTLSMGERLPVKKSTGEAFCVSVPVRNFDGSLAVKKGWIRRGEYVHEGWLPYTKRNVIETAFSLLGRPYGWHDSWGERDCGGIIRVIFNCFGFTLPRYWSFQQLCTDNAVYVGDIADTAEKASRLCALPAGITLTGSTGHIGLYVGNVDGKPYGINQCGWNYTEDDTEYKMARVVVSDYESVGFNMDKLSYFSPVMP